jgi:hypothetical protein
MNSKTFAPHSRVFCRDHGIGGAARGGRAVRLTAAHIAALVPRNPEAKALRIVAQAVAPIGWLSAPVELSVVLDAALTRAGREIEPSDAGSAPAARRYVRLDPVARSTRRTTRAGATALEPAAPGLTSAILGRRGGYDYDNASRSRREAAGASASASASAAFGAGFQATSSSYGAVLGDSQPKQQPATEAPMPVDDQPLEDVPRSHESAGAVLGEPAPPPLISAILRQKGDDGRQTASRSRAGAGAGAGTVEGAGAGVGVVASGRAAALSSTYGGALGDLLRRFDSMPDAVNANVETARSGGRVERAAGGRSTLRARDTALPGPVPGEQPADKGRTGHLDQHFARDRYGAQGDSPAVTLDPLDVERVIDELLRREAEQHGLYGLGGAMP